ncbi:MAG: hypothetical protein AB7E70_20345 [Hyphomicrobiaceae bacterium]
MPHDSNDTPAWRALTCSQCEGQLQIASPPGLWALSRWDKGPIPTKVTDTLPVLPLRCVDCGAVVLWAGAPGSADDMWVANATLEGVFLAIDEEYDRSQEE